MDPNLDHQPPFDLPSPSGEVNSLQATEKHATVPEKQAETKGIQAELSQTSPTQQPPVPAANPLLPPLPTTQHVPQPNPQAVSHIPQVADDVDLIEKEWVARAKDIVERTKNDPHLQNKEINKFKAEYIKKRYNKEVKVSDE